MANLTKTDTSAAKPLTRPGSKRKSPIEFPEPISADWKDPETFHEALALHMSWHRDSSTLLRRSVVKQGEKFDRKTLDVWKNGSKSPTTAFSFEILRRIEVRYRLPLGYFKAKLPHPGRATSGHRSLLVSAAERRRLAWHLPDDFDKRTPDERAEIIAWVREKIVTGGTEYRRYQSRAMKHSYAVRFDDFGNHSAGSRLSF